MYFSQRIDISVRKIFDSENAYTLRSNQFAKSAILIRKVHEAIFAKILNKILVFLCGLWVPFKHLQLRCLTAVSGYQQESPLGLLVIINIMKIVFSFPRTSIISNLEVFSLWHKVEMGGLIYLDGMILNFFYGLKGAF